MEAFIKLYTIVLIILASNLSEARPIDGVNRFKTKLMDILIDHNRVYGEVKRHRRSTLPYVLVAGMEPISKYLAEMEDMGSKTDLNPEDVYILHFRCLSIFRSAFHKLTIQELTLQEQGEENTFYNDVYRLKEKIGHSISKLRVLIDYDILSEEESPSVTLASTVDGNICDQECQLIENLYIHQRFNYYISLAHDNINALVVDITSAPR